MKQCAPIFCTKFQEERRVLLPHIFKDLGSFHLLSYWTLLVLFSSSYLRLSHMSVLLLVGRGKSVEEPGMKVQWQGVAIHLVP